jgi:F-box domain
MFLGDYPVPELLDNVLQYLATPDLAACALVNRQFKSHATAFLYRDMKLCLHLSSKKNFREYIRPSSIFWDPYITYPGLAQTKTLEINLNPVEAESLDLDYFFSDKFALPINIRRIFEQLDTLKLLEVVLPDAELSRRDAIERQMALVMICDEIGALKSNPDINFYGVNGDWATGKGNPIRRVNDRFKVLGLAIFDEIGPQGYSNLTSFRNLRDLYINLPRKGYVEGPCEIDWEPMFEGIPLTRLFLSSTAFRSLPRTVQHLYIGDDQDVGNEMLSLTNWAAVCALQDLETFCFSFDWIEEWDEAPMHFNSTNLLSLTATFNSIEEPRFVTRHILQPILQQQNRIRKISP